METFPLQGGDPGPLQENGKPGLSECRGRAGNPPQGDSTPATGKTGFGKSTQCRESKESTKSSENTESTERTKSKESTESTEVSNLHLTFINVKGIVWTTWFFCTHTHTHTHTYTHTHTHTKRQKIPTLFTIITGVDVTCIRKQGQVNQCQTPGVKFKN